MEAIFYEKKHFFWSHLEVRNLHPAHFILLPAHCSSYDICILCRAGTLIAWKCLQICCQKNQVVKKRERKSVIVWSLCVIASKPTWGAVLCVYCFCPVRMIHPSLRLPAAYRCYAHYLKIEVSQSHPVMKAFCGMLLQSVGQDTKAGQRSRDAEEGL